MKGRNGMDLTEAEAIKKKWQEYTEGLYKKKKDPHDPDNHNGVITHLEPDILECKAKWALGSITTKKARRGKGIPVELFQILKDGAGKGCTQIATKFGKLSGGYRTGKGQFPFQSQRRAMPKNVQTAVQLHLFHMLARLCSKSCKLGFSSMLTQSFQMFNLDLEKAEEPEITLPTSIGT